MDTVTIELTFDEFNRISKALGREPYEEVTGLVNKLADQVRKQVEKLGGQVVDNTGRRILGNDNSLVRRNGMADHARGEAFPISDVRQTPTDLRPNKHGAGRKVRQNREDPVRKRSATADHGN